MGVDDEVIRLEPLRSSYESLPINDSAKKKGRAAFVNLDVDSCEVTYVPWIEGLKGILAIESCLWLSFRTYIPTVVYSGVVEQPPGWQVIFRKIFCPLLWDGTLQWSFFIILSGRIVALKFLHRQTPESMASSIFKRPFRFLPPVVFAMSIAALLNHKGGYDAIAELRVVGKNGLTGLPYQYKTVLAWLNAMFNVFWFQDALQAGVLAHPGAQLWVVTTCYNESYTIYMTMLLLPYMTRYWRVQLLVLFILAAWWLNSWAWYSVTGLILADNVQYIRAWGTQFWIVDLNHSKIKFHVPYWSVPMSMVIISTFIKYFYATLRPDLYNNEYSAHTSTYLVGGTIKGYVDYSRPNQRVDNYFFVLGSLLLIEMSPRAQKFFSNGVLQYIGHLSFSMFLLQGCITYTVGIKMFLYFVRDLHWNAMSATVVILIVDIPLLWIASDVYARLFDYSGRRMAIKLFDWFST